jgi:hypothetical protein
MYEKISNGRPELGQEKHVPKRKVHLKYVERRGPKPMGYDSECIKLQSPYLRNPKKKGDVDHVPLGIAKALPPRTGYGLIGETTTGT